MKTKITLLIALCFVSFVSVKATKHLVATTAEFSTAWGAYTAGDTIVMSPGTYSAFGDKSISKSVVIMASDTSATATKPVIVGAQFIYTAVGASFVINGIEAYYYAENAAVTDSKYFLQAVASGMSSVTIPLISIRNCSIHGYSRGLFRADSSTATNMPNITMLFMNNCLVYDISRVRADYSIFACKSAKFSNVRILKSTFYNCPAGVWYNENTDTPVNLLIENCCILKTTNVTTTGTQTNASKLVIYSNGNAGSTRTIRNTVISDSFDGSVTNMQIKFGSDGTTSWSNIDNVILGNNFNTPKFNSTVLTTNNEVAVSSLTYDYATLTLNIGATVSNMGHNIWTINSLSTGQKNPETLNAKIYLSGASIHIENLPLMAKVDVFSVNGKQLYSANTISHSLVVPVSEKMSIVRISSNGKTQSGKVGF